MDLISRLTTPSNKNKILLIVIIVVGFFAKLLFFYVKIGDFVMFLEPWINFIKDNGYERALKYNFYDYSPSYIYFLVLVAKIGLNPLYLVKFISVFFDYVLAFFVGKIVRIKFDNKFTILLSLAVVPLIPTVFVNSSYLSQCDSIYSAFVVMSIYYALRDKNVFSIISLGLAFSFKMQAVFILPFFFVMLLRKKIPFYCFLIAPAVFFLSLVPAWIYGRPLHELLTIYLEQADKYHFLTLNFPNVYIWFNNDYYSTLKSIGIFTTVLGTVISGILLANKKYVFEFDDWVRLALASCLIAPFFLPGMHERYLYLADVLSVLYFFVIRKNIGLPISIISISLYSYIRTPVRFSFLPMEPAFFLYIIVIAFVVRDLYLHIRSGKSLPNTTTIQST